jgi:hypothetical protein
MHTMLHYIFEPTQDASLGLTGFERMLQLGLVVLLGYIGYGHHGFIGMAGSAVVAYFGSFLIIGHFRGWAYIQLMGKKLREGHITQEQYDMLVNRDQYPR